MLDIRYNSELDVCFVIGVVKMTYSNSKKWCPWVISFGVSVIRYRGITPDNTPLRRTRESRTSHPRYMAFFLV